MSLWHLSWRFLWARPLLALLNIALLALGLAAVSLVALTSEQVERGLSRDLRGIDLVVGAKGSPLQLILAGVFHLDVPSGNIPATTINTLTQNPLVETVVPLSLGDSLAGYRIVGTTPAYAGLYELPLAQGLWWQKPLQAVLGAEVAQTQGLGLGQSFVGVHGLGQGGPAHDGEAYTVVGVLQRCACVLDRLVLTDVASVWAVHEAHGHAAPAVASAASAAGSSRLAHDPHEDHDHHHDDHDHDKDKPKTVAVASASAEPDLSHREVTVLLVRYRSPLAAVSLPRWVNAQDGLQAAAPALESARLLRMVGVGIEVLRGFGLLLVLVAGASVFIALYHAVREREPDLAMMRMLGASRGRIAKVVLLEALNLATLGLIVGLSLGHGLTEVLGRLLAAQHAMPVTGWWWSTQSLWLILGAYALAIVAAVLPALRAARLDVTRLLQNPH
ncbi:ABC transporter permease [Ideonella paludis]|uniref:ABC transporter permease n=1 Tax=Ideonella paludis TaxID=1233411 RepID=A0ABS5E2L9_9BURK|nr:FtsX-like permease family protein [Ideonella paludis]MBQ0937621.1 ABC transporter permease [Ideonella paludis]